MAKYQDTTDGANTWNIELYRTESTSRTIEVTRNGDPVTFDNVIQEIRTTTDNRLVYKLTLGDGISVDTEQANKIHFDYSGDRTAIKTGSYVHDIFFIDNGQRRPYIKRSRFNVNQNVGEPNEQPN